MATQTSIIQITGRLGNTVGRRLPGGRYTLSIHRPHIRNPRTPAQTANRSTLALATQIASRLGHVIQLVKILTPREPYAHNRLVGQIKARLAVSTRQGLFPAQLPLLKNPDLEAAYTTLTLTRDTYGATLHAELDPRLAARLQTTAVAIIAYNQTRNLFQSISLLRQGLPLTRLPLPEAWAEDDIQLAAYILPLLRPQNPDKDTLDAAQITAIHLMPDNPVTTLPIYHKNRPRTTTRATRSRATSFSLRNPVPTSVLSTAQLRDNSELTPSLPPQNAPDTPSSAPPS